MRDSARSSQLSAVILVRWFAFYHHEMTVPTLAGTFYKTGGIFTGYRERSYRLEWLGKRLEYGDKGLSFDLTKVVNLTVKVEQVDIHHQKNAFHHLSRRKLTVAGVLSLEFENTGRRGLSALTRHFVLPDLAEFNTFAYWVMAAVERHTKARFDAKHDAVQQFVAAAGKAYFSRRVARIFERAYDGVLDGGSIETSAQFLQRQNLQLQNEGGKGAANMSVHGLEPMGADPKPDDVPLAVKLAKRPAKAEVRNIFGEGLGMTVFAMLMREAKTMVCAHRAGRHPNILALRGLEFFSDGALIVFEFLPLNVDAWRQTHLTGERKLIAIEKMLRGLLSGYARLHDAGVYHLDQKLDNLMFRNDGEPVIIDFNIARGRELDSNNHWRKIYGGNDYWNAPEDGLTPTEERDFELIDSFRVGLLLLRLMLDAPIIGPTRSVDQLKGALDSNAKPLAPKLRTLGQLLLPLIELDRTKRSTVRELWEKGSPLRELLDPHGHAESRVGRARSSQLPALKRL